MKLCPDSKNLRVIFVRFKFTRVDKVSEDRNACLAFVLSGAVVCPQHSSTRFGRLPEKGGGFIEAETPSAVLVLDCSAIDSIIRPATHTDFISIIQIFCSYNLPK